MSIPLSRRKRRARDHARQDWIDDRLREARIVVADVVHHSDHLLRLACNVLVRHGESDDERKDARILLVILDARSPTRSLGRFDRPGCDRERQP
jgi:hypothetical protein